MQSLDYFVQHLNSLSPDDLLMGVAVGVLLLSPILMCGLFFDTLRRLSDD